MVVMGSLSSGVVFGLDGFVVGGCVCWGHEILIEFAGRMAHNGEG